MSFPLRPIASSSRLLARRSYASAPSSNNPHLLAPQDTRVDVIRQSLYPSNAHSPTSASPTGAYHSQHLERLTHVIHSEEVYETIERAFRLFQRRARERRDEALKAQMAAMVEACEELDTMTKDANRYLYERAMARPSLSAGRTEDRGRKQSQESKFLEGRIPGLIPRESWVPVESRGKGWNYGWRRPSKD
ncbi:large subunit ribosomal protein L40, partial [Tremellales sp. Uapishka_1]